jgi:hypothetical protein
MLLKKALLALSVSLVCLTSSVSAKASAITIGTDYFMSVSPYASGEQNGGSPDYYVGYTTITLYADNGGVQGAQVAQYNQAYCIDFFDKITPSTPAYVVQAQGVGTSYNSSLYPNPATPAALSAYLGSTYYNDDGSVTVNNDALPNKLAYDAVLGAEFNGNDTNDTNIQEVIWDEGGASFSLNSTANSEATAAQNLVNGSSSFTSNDIAFLEIDGDGQSFMANVPAAVTPEPSTLVLLGTGLLGTACAMRRRLRTA